MKVVLVQCKKLEQYQKEIKNHFESYYAVISFIKISKGILLTWQNVHRRYTKTGTNIPAKLCLYWSCTHSTSAEA